MPAGVPVLGEAHVPEVRCNTIDARDDIVSMRNCQSTSTAEVVLNIDDEQQVRRSEL
jgi:hypothetical protein